MDSETQRAQAGWSAFVRFAISSTAAVALALILMGVFLL